MTLISKRYGNSKCSAASEGAVLSRLPLALGLLAVGLFFWSAADGWAKTGARTSPSVKTRAPQAHHPKSEQHKKAPKVAKGVRAKAVYCVNVAKNQTLAARNSNQRLPIASLTKLVTALVVLDRMPLNRLVTVPGHIKKIPKSVVGLKPKDRVSVKDLLHGLLIGSGNDCAETLACAYPGGRARFIRTMNAKVRKFGTKHTIFYTPSGLDKKTAGTWNGKKSVHVRSNVSTAREMARIARAAFANRTIRSICLKKRYTMAGRLKKGGYRVSTTNKLLRDNLPLAGGKTGYTARAGHCLATEFKPGRDNFLIVVLGSPNHFRDTRLVYRNALKKTKAMRKHSAHRRPDRVAAN